MEWNLFNYEEILNKPKVQKKKYTEKEYREYIIENFKADYTNKVFFNDLHLERVEEWVKN